MEGSGKSSRTSVGATGCAASRFSGQVFAIPSCQIATLTRRSNSSLSDVTGLIRVVVGEAMANKRRIC